MKPLSPYLVVLLLACACTPVVMPAGAPVTEPELGESFLTMADGTALTLHSWPSEDEPRAVILALHGFNDYGNAFALPAVLWAQEGILTYAYDQRGFGASKTAGYWSGSETLAQDARVALALLAEQHPDLPIFLLGSSMGGAVAAVAALEGSPDSLDGLVLVAPAVWGRGALPWSYRTLLWLVAHLAPGMTLSGSGLDIRPSDNIEMLRALGRDPLIIRETRADTLYGLVNLMGDGLEAAGATDLPVLIIYGENDQIVPATPVAVFAERMDGPVRLGLYPESYHMVLRDLSRDIPLNDIASFVLDPQAPLPSGNEVTPEKPGALQAEN